MQSLACQSNVSQSNVSNGASQLQRFGLRGRSNILAKKLVDNWVFMGKPIGIDHRSGLD
jgi:hypothetical protein